MAMTALAPYSGEKENVKKALTNAQNFLSRIQTDKGGYANMGQENSTSAAQALIGIVLSGDDPTSEKYTKNGNNVIDSILSYRIGAGFKWIDSEKKVNDMATEQVLAALVQYQFVMDGKGSIFVWSKEKTPADVEPKPVPDQEPDHEKDQDQKETPKDTEPQPDSQEEPKEQAKDSNQPPENKDQGTEPVDSQNKEATDDSSKGHKLPNTSLYGWDLVLLFGFGLLLTALGFIIYRKTSRV
jgi:hypothetical protein